jgi:transcriptional regulator with XRE-family HTH domain
MIRPEGDLKRGLEEGIKGSHVRGARALLDWSMADLAKASKLSLSTIRRLEEDGLGEAARSLPRVLAALRACGIVFLLVEGGGIAIARR